MTTVSRMYRFWTVILLFHIISFFYFVSAFRGLTKLGIFRSETNALGMGLALTNRISGIPSTWRKRGLSWMAHESQYMTWITVVGTASQYLWVGPVICKHHLHDYVSYTSTVSQHCTPPLTSDLHPWHSFLDNLLAWNLSKDRTGQICVAKIAKTDLKINEKERIICGRVASESYCHRVQRRPC